MRYFFSYILLNGREGEKRIYAEDKESAEFNFLVWAEKEGIYNFLNKYTLINKA